ncbi:MAG: 2-oxo-hept-4-ene-1,7-dioate hydratase [Pseudomonadota bacterium]
MTPAEITAAAEDLLMAERTGRQIGLLSLRHPEMTLDDAYAVQAALIEAMRAEGRRVIGWKIGLTSRAMQQALGIETPDSGVLLDDMLFEDGATVPAGRFIAPRVEAEIAFLMQAPLAAAEVSRADVLAATRHVAPVLEILDTRILRQDPETGASRQIVDTVADNAANGGLVLGPERHRPADVDLPWVGAVVRRNDMVEETGLGAGVLGDPVESVVWLARRLHRYGSTIAAGDIVLSGSFIRPIECPPGTEIDSDFGPFGRVRCAFG